MLIEIKSRFDSRVIFSHDCENNSIKLTVEAAVRIRANLDGVYLAGAYLDGANLAGAYLDGAYLDGANLDGANLVRANRARANLVRANLDGANLAGAYLDGANLARANLDGANLDGANLARANLVRANLDGANLDGANLDGANLAGAIYGIATLTKGILQILGLRWSVMIFDAHIKIGCEFHSTQEWIDFDDEKIAKMDSHAAEFWKKNRELILLAAKTHQGG